MIEQGVSYEREPTHGMKPFQYSWFHRPTNNSGIVSVYCYKYSDFIKLVNYWNHYADEFQYEAITKEEDTCCIKNEIKLCLSSSEEMEDATEEKMMEEIRIFLNRPSFVTGCTAVSAMKYCRWLYNRLSMQNKMDKPNQKVCIVKGK